MISVKRIKQGISVILTALLIFSFTSCSDRKPEETTADTTTEAQTTAYPAPENSLLLFDGESFLYKMIRPEKTSDVTLRAFTSLRNALSTLAGGTSVKLSDDFIKNESEIGEREIAIGKTNRPITASLTSKMGAMASYEISVSDRGIAICGTSDSQTEQGVRYFIDTYLKENTVKVGDKVYIKCGSYSSEKTMPSFGQYLSYCKENGKEMSFTSEEYMQIPPINDHTIMQGGCIDAEGKYAYFLFQKNNVSSIAKYDFANKELVATNYKIGTDHSNDACFNPKLNAVVVVHNAPNYKLISMFDADTLERKGAPIHFTENIYSIAYNEETDRYIVGISGDYNFAVLDSDFNIVSRFTGAKTGYTRQGVNADSEYIYFVQSTGTTQYIVVYKWDGTHVGTLPLTGIKYEVEHAFHIGTQLYISCYCGGSKGGVTYKINLNIE